jgi:hypothetical protein
VHCTGRDNSEFKFKLRSAHVLSGLRIVSGLMGMSLIAGCVGLALTAFAAAQSPAPNDSTFIEEKPAKARSALQRIGIGVKMGTLGIGFEAAAQLTQRINVRAGFSMFRYTTSLTSDGVETRDTVSLQSLETHFDWFPFGNGFHISPGLLFTGNNISGTGFVPAGHTLSLGDSDYLSSQNDPLHGDGKVKFNRTAPLFTVGWGNLVPRSEKHFSFPIEFGVAYQGEPKVRLALNGDACESTGTYCQNILGDPAVETNLRGQAARIKRNVSIVRWYPIVSTGVSFRF